MPQSNVKDAATSITHGLDTSLAVSGASPEDEAAAQELAALLKLPFVTAADAELFIKHRAPPYAALLTLSGKRLSLAQTGRGAPGPVSVDFGSPAMRHRRRGGANELLGKAVGVGKKEHLQVLDATAGLGRDAFVLADLGCHVQLCERHPVIAQLLRAGIACAQDSGDPWLDTVLSRMTLWAGDTRECPAQTLASTDVIYVDPMFAQRGKSAAAKKDMAAFQRLLHHDVAGDAASGPDSLVNWALAQKVARVVVKRPLKAEPLAQLKPSHAIRGKAVRYDVHVLHKL